MRRPGRAVAMLVATVVAGVTAVTTASPAPAVPRFQAVITCDEAANRVTTGTIGSGALVPGTPVRVEFRFLRGSAVRSGVIETVPAVPPVTVNATVAADGSLTTTGYTRPWQGAGYEFYTETVEAAVYHRTTGRGLTSPQATCTKDTRTTVTLECDPAAGTITAHARGTGYPLREAASQPVFGNVTVQYWVSTTIQATPDSPRFTGTGSSPRYVHRVPLTGGEWAETGYEHTVLGNPFYLSQDLRVEVLSGQWSRPIGAGTASCVYAGTS